MNQHRPLHWQLCFRPLARGGRGFAFPCNARGEVHLDSLGDRTRNDYLFARAMVGRELAPPVVEGERMAQAA